MVAESATDTIMSKWELQVEVDEWIEIENYE